MEETTMKTERRLDEMARPRNRAYRFAMRRAALCRSAVCLGVLIAGAGLAFGDADAQVQPLTAPSTLLNGSDELVVPLYQSKVVRLDVPAQRISVGNPDIADILILRSTQLYVLGKDLGTTNVLVWDSQDRLIGTVNIEVVHDLDSLKRKLHELLPNEDIQVYSVQRSIVLAGQVSSATAMDAAIRVANTYLGQGPASGESKTGTQEGAGAPQMAAAGANDKDKPQVINLMQVGGVQQVMLEIKVAEINRTELKSMNAQFNSLKINGGTTFGGVNGGATFPDVEFKQPVEGRMPVFNGIAPWGPAIDEFAPKDMTIGNQGLYASFLTDNSLFNLALDIAKENRLAKILAEPTLTTLTGEEATFLSGGEIAIPVPQGDFRTTFEFKQFGVQVSFLPVVLGSGLINLKVDVTVSEITRIDPGSLIPLQLGTRKATSSVELREGQTMGLAGLINDATREGVHKFPGLGGLPVLGALFRSQDFLNQQTELVITVTPHLAKPMAPGDVRLPTDNFKEPNDGEFFIMGRLEGGKRKSASGAGAGSSASSAAGSAAAGGVNGTFGHQLN
jgi:pilus assembly protein CpaC